MFIMRNENVVHILLQYNNNHDDNNNNIIYKFMWVLYIYIIIIRFYYLSSLNNTHVYHFYSLSFGRNREVNIFFHEKSCEKSQKNINIP